MERVTYHEAHKGASHGNEEKGRRNGLLEVGLVRDGSYKEMLRVKRDRVLAYDLGQDAREAQDLAEDGSLMPSAELLAFRQRVQAGLDASDVMPTGVLTDEDVEQLRALGYLD